MTVGKVVQFLHVVSSLRGFRFLLGLFVANQNFVKHF